MLRPVVWSRRHSRWVGFIPSSGIYALINLSIYNKHFGSWGEKSLEIFQHFYLAFNTISLPRQKVAYYI